jgi:hypothetical protein
MKLLLRGAVILIAVAVGTFFLSAFGMERFGFSAASVSAFRVVTYLALAVLFLVYVILPQLKRVSDETVALYLEENEPSLDASMVSALEVGPERPAGPEVVSPGLAERLVQMALDEVRKVEGGRRVERGGLRRATAALAAVAMLSLIALVSGPSYLRHGASALLFPFRSAEAANPYSILVEPGDATVSRGSDQMITANLLGFAEAEVQVLFRSESQAGFERVPMTAVGDSAAYEAFLFDLDEEAEYFVQAGNVRSPLFHISVEDLPYVERLELQYHFPAYTGLAPRTIDDGGDIAVLRGTVVHVRAVPTIPTSGGQLVEDGERVSSLTVEEEGSLLGEFRVDRRGFYRIDLLGPRGQLVPASPEYAIDLLSDLPPSVSFEEPGRDTRASAIEEVFVEARADDDYGIGNLDLVYSVNGGEEQTVSLYSAGGPPLKEVTAGHTFFLEELELEPGDFISYYARAADNNRVDGRQSIASDIYFIQIRPFRKDFRQAEQRGSTEESMQGGEGQPEAALSQTQREIIAGTFNLFRDREQYSPDQYQEALTTLSLAQERLREQVETLVQRLRTRGVVQDGSGFETILEELPRAAEAMEGAVRSLRAGQAQEALSPEQQALRHLQRAEETYRDVQVSFGGNPGGGSQPSPSAEDLADLFELELDKLKNQYETLQRRRQEETSAEVDETMERLKELARRQQQEGERQRQRAMRSQGGGQGAGSSQRELADETEEAARQLERLSRESSNRSLADAARRLQEAADAMRRAAAASGNAGVAEAQAAQERLDEARRLIDRNRSRSLEQDIQDAVRRSRDIAANQRDISNQVRGLGETGDRQEQLRRLMERKDQMETEVANLERQLDRLAAESRREDRAASRRLAEAASSIRDNKVKEKIRYSKGLAQARSPEDAAAFEEEIAADLEELGEHLAEARSALASNDENRSEELIDRTRDLARDLESLDRRLRDRAGASPQSSEEQGGQGSEGQPSAQEEGRTGATDRGLQAQQMDPSIRGRQGRPPRQSDAGGRQQPGQVPQAGDAAGPPGRLGGTAGSRPPPLSTDEIRQFRREAQQREKEARALRDLLREEGFDTDQLDQILRGIRQLDDERVYRDFAEIERLQAALLEGIRRLEFVLLRELRGPDPERLLLPGTDEVPPGFRDLIEEYYRSLSRNPGR